MKIEHANDYEAAARLARLQTTQSSSFDYHEIMHAVQPQKSARTQMLVVRFGNDNLQFYRNKILFKTILMDRGRDRPAPGEDSNWFSLN